MVLYQPIVAISHNLIILCPAWFGIDDLMNREMLSNWSAFTLLRWTISSASAYFGTRVHKFSHFRPMSTYLVLFGLVIFVTRCPELLAKKKLPVAPVIGQKLFDVNQLIPKETQFEMIIKFAIYGAALFQIVCLAALFLFPIDENLEDNHTENNFGEFADAQHGRENSAAANSVSALGLYSFHAHILKFRGCVF